MSAAEFDLRGLVAALPRRFAHLADYEDIRFIAADGTEDTGIRPDAVVAICRAVIEAYECGELPAWLHDVVPNARNIQKAITGFDWSALKPVEGRS